MSRDTRLPDTLIARRWVLVTAGHARAPEPDASVADVVENCPNDHAHERA
jgi:hypothetical protein